jgi:hypothetical protein
MTRKTPAQKIREARKALNLPFHGLTIEDARKAGIEVVWCESIGRYVTIPE